MSRYMYHLLMFRLDHVLPTIGEQKPDCRQSSIRWTCFSMFRWCCRKRQEEVRMFSLAHNRQNEGWSTHSNAQPILQSCPATSTTPPQGRLGPKEREHNSSKCQPKQQQVCRTVKSSEHSPTTVVAEHSSDKEVVAACQLYSSTSPLFLARLALTRIGSSSHGQTARSVSCSHRCIWKSVCL